VGKMAASAGVWLLAMSAALAGIHNLRRSFVVSSPLSAESSARATRYHRCLAVHTHTHTHTRTHTLSKSVPVETAARRHAGQLALGVWPFLNMRPPSLEDHQCLPERCTGRPTTPFTSVPTRAHACEIGQKCWISGLHDGEIRISTHAIHCDRALTSGPHSHASTPLRSSRDSGGGRGGAAHAGRAHQVPRNIVVVHRRA
jgi:hypothetical protein